MPKAKSLSKNKNSQNGRLCVLFSTTAVHLQNVLTHFSYCYSLNSTTSSPSSNKKTILKISWLKHYIPVISCFDISGKIHLKLKDGPKF